MTEVAILKLLDLGLMALSVGLERHAILDRVSGLQAQGATPEQIAEALVQMRNEAIAKAQASIG